MRENDYPYSGDDYGSCKYSSSLAVVTNTGFVSVPVTEQDHLNYLNVAPLSVCLNASPIKYYESGVFSATCATGCTHAVVMVGYGTTNDGKDYYLVKNSWGEWWGESGYIRISRDYANSGKGLCGILANSV